MTQSKRRKERGTCESKFSCVVLQVLLLTEEGAMNAKTSLTAGWKLRWLTPLLGLVLAAGVGYAAERLLIPEDLNLPFYARGLGHTDSGLSAMVLYTLPEDVPDGVNLLTMHFDIERPSLLVEGFAVLKEGALAPIQEQLKNAPGKQVPICFANADEMLAARADWVLTTDELLGLPSLVIGWADSYSEILHPLDPLDPTKPWQLNVVASGFLEKDGTPFFLHSNGSSGNLIVRFGE
jgi:hypothetical protein